jgi:hypothetical protein
LLRRIPLHPFEWIALAASTGVMGVLAALGLPITTASMRDTVVNMGAVLPAALALGAVLQGYYQWTEKRPLGPYLRSLASRESLLLWFRLWLACWIVSFAYFWLKVYVPLLHDSTFDESLWRMDRLVHLGLSPSTLAVGLLGSTPLAGWLDTWYSVWLASVVWALAFFAASEDFRLRRRVILSSLLLWITGVIVYVMLPALGPVFVFEEVWLDVRGSMPLAEQAQDLLITNYRAVVATGESDPSTFDHRLGVAALPSLHVGFHVLFALWAWQHARVVRVVFVVMSVLTFVGSLLTGWHYAIDGYLGAALAVACYWAALHLEREPDTPGDAAAPTKGSPEAIRNAVDPEPASTS